MPTHQFVVNKTSLDMFDAFRAYGLASILSSQDYLVHIRDWGFAYTIETPDEIPTAPDSIWFSDTDGWSRVFITYRERKDSKKTHPKNDVEDIITKNYDTIVNKHRRSDFFPTIGRQVTDGTTLYQSLDVSASKGYREGKRDVYHEGTQLEVDKYSWALACVGAAWYGVWRYSDSFILSLIPNPADVILNSHRTIQKDLDTRVCVLSDTIALTHYAVRLALLIAERQQTMLKYDSIIFNTMKKTGQQPKPGGGGHYEMSFLESLSKSDSGHQALAEIDHQFPTSQHIKGIKQSLALVLADFLINPSLENYRAFARLYIRGQIKKELYPWEKEQLEAILKHVKTSLTFTLIHQ
jgi:hypothetical protein